MPDGELERYDDGEVEEGGQETSYEVPLDDEPDGELEPVHEGDAVARLPLDGERRPVIPGWLQSTETARAELARVTGTAWHHSMFHAVRSPWYLVKTLLWAVLGAAVLAGRLAAWLAVSEHVPLRSHAVINDDSREYRAVTSHAKRIRDERRIMAGVALFGVVLAVDLVIRFAPHPGWIGIGAAVVAVVALARAGRWRTGRSSPRR